MAVFVDIFHRITGLTQCGFHLIGRDAGRPVQGHVQRHAYAQRRDKDIRFRHVFACRLQQIEGKGIVFFYLFRLFQDDGMSLSQRLGCFLIGSAGAHQSHDSDTHPLCFHLNPTL